jgi:hypothetical protein
MPKLDGCELCGVSRLEQASNRARWDALVVIPSIDAYTKVAFRQAL